MPRLQAIVILMLVAVSGLVAHGSASADVVEMLDGRRFEGEIVSEEESFVRMDTKVTSSIRTTVRLPRSEINSIERKPLPEGFFDPPPAAPRVSGAQDFSGGDTLYLEVPIKGEFGRDVFADGVDDVVRYARRYRISHIVFVVDSTGGELEDVQATYDVLRRNRKSLTFHAIIHQCLGDALAVAVWCDTIHLVPGAVIGGVPSVPTSASVSRGRPSDGLVRAQIAREVVRQTGITGPQAEIVGAMIDPARSLAGWRDEVGEISVSDEVAAGVPPQQVIFEVGPERALELSYEQGIALGLKPFDGGSKDLGEILGFEGWKPESDYGAEAMAAVVERRQQQAADASAKYAESVEENLSRRETLERFLEEALRHAAEWDPSHASYDYYSRRLGWSWQSNRVRMTSQSRQLWQQRTDQAMGYLQQAAQAVTALERLNKEGIELGLESAFTPQDLHWMKSDIQSKYDSLAINRNRR